MTEVHIGELTSRVEATGATSTDDAFVARVAVEVAKRLQEAGELARAATLGDTDVFGDAGQES